MSGICTLPVAGRLSPLSGVTFRAGGHARPTALEAEGAFG